MKEIEKGAINWNISLWRYMNADRLIENIKSKKIYFASAKEFEDDFEGAVSLHSKDDYYKYTETSHYRFAEKAFKELKRLTKINCWHCEDHECNAMWKLYADSRKGIAICSSPKMIKEAIKPYRIKPNYGEEDLYIGLVKYVDLSSMEIHDTSIKTFFYKHNIFSWEKELRLVISLERAEGFGVRVPERGIFVDVDYSKLLSSIVIGPEITEEKKNEIAETCVNMGIKVNIEESSLMLKPRFAYFIK